MAKKFLTGLTLVNLDSDPLVGSEGELYFNTSASVAKIYKSGAWSEIGGGGGLTTVDSAPPESPQIGETWFNDSNGSFYIYDGNFWVEITSVIENPPISQEEVQDYVAPLLNHSNHTNISASYDDINNQILLSASASFTTEEIQDAIAPLFEHSSHSNISAVYDDENNQIILSASASSGAGITISTTAPENPEVGSGWYNNETGVFAVYDGTYWVEVNGVIENPPLSQEEIQDYVAPLLNHSNHLNISASYDDLNNEIILSASAGGTGTGVTISETAPESPSEGDAWYKGSTGAYYLYDGSYWVEVNGIINGLTEDQVQDYVGPLFTHSNHTNVTATYDDANNQILLNTSASITNIDSIVYPDYVTFDTTPEIVPTEQGSVYWDSGDEGLRVVNNNTTTLLGQELYALVKNNTGSSIAKGKVVYITGAQGQRPTIALADADMEITSSKTFGFTAETIADEADGLVTTDGILRGIDTDGLTEGGAVWLSSSGNYTQIMPTQPEHGVFLGYVVKANQSSGEIFVKIQNGYELNELHNVLISGSVQNLDLLSYESSSGLWKNKTASEAGLLTLSQASSSDQIILASQIFG